MPIPSDSVQHAYEHLQAGRWAEAEAVCRRLLGAPQAVGALFVLGLVFRRTGRAGQAAAAFRALLAVDPGAAGAFVQLGLVLRGAGRAEAAETVHRRAVRLAPEASDASYELAQTLRLRERWPEAERRLRHVVRRRPDYLDAHFFLGLTAMEQGGFEVAEASFRHVLALRPDALEACLNLGVTAQQTGRFAAAEACYRRALVLRPGEPAANARLGQILLVSGRPREAAQAFRAALSVSPADEEWQSALERARRGAMLAAAARDPAVPAGLVVRGSFRDTSGYAHMVRRFTRGLVDRGERIHLIDVRVSSTPVLARGQRDRLLESLDRPVCARAVLNFTTPQLAEPIPGLRSVLFSMFEGRAVPRDWVPHSAGHAHLIVPTESSRQAWVAGGLPEARIHLCPLGVEAVPDPAALTPMALSDAAGRPLSEYRTRILNVSEFASRKNLDGLIRVWLRATRSSDDAVLVLKPGKAVHPADPTFRAFLEQVARSVGRSLAEAAPIVVVYGRYSDDEMLSLFAAATHYWSMSHAEGWDLPMTQAGALGLRLIAPDHSAYQAYLDPTVASLIPARPGAAIRDYGVVPVPSYYPPVWMCRDQEWWDPDETAAAELVARAVTGRDAPVSARHRLVREFGWPKAAERLAALLRRIDAL